MKAKKKNPDVRYRFLPHIIFSLAILCTFSFDPADSSSSPIQISLPLPLASGPQPVTIKSGSSVNTNNNDVIGYIVVPYPGSGVNDQRNDLSALAAQPAAAAVSPYFSL